MAKRVIQFPVRNAFPPVPPQTEGSLARNNEGQTQRIVAQVEAELARKAERMATGLRLEFERVREQEGRKNLSLWQRFRYAIARITRK